MVSNLSTIGFEFADDADFRDAMIALAEEATVRLASPAGDYAIWRAPSGAEIWFHLAAPDHRNGGGEREIAGLTPFFEGRSDIAVELTEAFQRAGDSPFEGALQAWVAPDGKGGGAFPLVFDAVDYAARAADLLPRRTRVRLTGFARELDAYATPAAYQAAQTTEPRFAAQAFIPIGLFTAAVGEAGADGKRPSSVALVTGRVAAHERRHDPDGAAFHWLAVESLAATFDIVAAPAVITGDITVGGTVKVACSLFGRCLP